MHSTLEFARPPATDQFTFEAKTNKNGVNTPASLDANIHADRGDTAASLDRLFGRQRSVPIHELTPESLYMSSLTRAPTFEAADISQIHTDTRHAVEMIAEEEKSLERTQILKLFYCDEVGMSVDSTTKTDSGYAMTLRIPQRDHSYNFGPKDLEVTLELDQASGIIRWEICGIKYESEDDSPTLKLLYSAAKGSRSARAEILRPHITKVKRVTSESDQASSNGIRTSETPSQTHQPIEWGDLTASARGDGVNFHT